MPALCVVGITILCRLCFLKSLAFQFHLFRYHLCGVIFNLIVISIPVYTP